MAVKAIPFKLGTVQPDGFGPTVPLVASPPPARFYRQGTVVGAIGIAAFVGLGIGVVIARTTAPEIVVPVNTRGELKVSAKGTEANVVVDGRFVGVTPIDRLALDPGKHSVVLDAFGFQPYAGTIGIEERGVMNLSVLMAPIGSETPTRGTVGGRGTMTHSEVPASALLPAARAQAPATVAPPAPTRRPAPAVFERPHRDCSGEHSSCRSSCSSADFSCTSSCQGCGSCSGNWDDCNRQCKTCKDGCAQNVKFCESSCDNQESNCSR